MNAEALLESLWRRGAHVVVRGDLVLTCAPPGVLTDDDRANLRRVAPDILRMIGRRPRPER